MPQLTVVVPLMDQVDAFEETLASILRFCDRHIQLVVTHDGRYDDPHQILDEVESVVVPSHRNTSVIGRVAAACDACQSPWIHWLAPGIEVTQQWFDELLESLTRQSDVGLISPQIHSVELNDSQLQHCVGSCVVSQPTAHPQYLEDVYGEEWTLSEVTDDCSIVGPTGWAGLCRKQLLQQWHEDWNRQRLPEGYAELSLGLMVQRDGWRHQIGQSQVYASEDAVAAMEQGFRRDGRAAAAIMGRLQTGSAFSKMIRSIGYGAREIATAILYPGNFSVGMARFTNLSAAGITLAPVEPVVSLSQQEAEQDMQFPSRRAA